MRNHRPWLTAAGLALLVGGVLPSSDRAGEGKDKPALSSELRPPVRLEADGKPIDTAVGHAAPHLADLDGDGKLDLLVGQFGDGILWIYRNVGTNTAPRYAAGIQFKDGNPDGRVPTA